MALGEMGGRTADQGGKLKRAAQKIIRLTLMWLQKGVSPGVSHFLHLPLLFINNLARKT